VSVERARRDLSGPCFLETMRDVEGAKIALLGVPFDGTASYRAGARFGPDAIRRVSVALETYSPHQDRDYADFEVSDWGNLEVGSSNPERVVASVYAATHEILGGGTKPFLLGGDHSWTAGAVRAVYEKYPNLAIVQFDAHADLRPEYLGEKFSHASAIARCIDVVGPDAVLQVGIRSGPKSEWEEMRAADRYVAAGRGRAEGEASPLRGPAHLPDHRPRHLRPRLLLRHGDARAGRHRLAVLRAAPRCARRLRDGRRRRGGAGA
jgi:agmatinase